MKINVNIEEELEELWAEMGLTPEQIEEQWNILSQKIEILIQSFLKETHDKVQNLRQEAEKVETQVVQQMKFFDLGDDYGLNSQAPLIKRIDIAKRRLNNLVEATADQKEDFDKCYEELQHCFDLLEIEDRGEFADKGENYGINKIDAMTDKTNELQAKIVENQSEVNELCEQLTDLHDILELEKFVKPKTCGDPTLESLHSEIEELTAKYEKNFADANQTLKEIHRLERLLGEKQTSQKLVLFGDPTVKSLHERLDYLNDEKEKKLDYYVETLKKELLRLWGELHMETPEKTEFPFFYTKHPTKRTLVALESEVLRLERLKESIEPLMNLIAQRQEIIDAYDNIQKLGLKPEMYQSRKSSAASAIAQEGRVRRRYEVELPKLHDQMIHLLQDYQDTYGEPLIWDGKNLLEEISAQREKELAKRPRRNPNNTVSMTKTKTRVNNLANRAPFQLQSYMI